jgi:hypothetical protein
VANELARLQLDFWIESTKRIRQLQEQFPDRVLLVNRQELIASPREKIATIGFLPHCRTCHYPGIACQNTTFTAQ